MAGPRQGALGAPSRQHPVPSAWPARRLSPPGSSLLRPTRLRAELGAAEEKGASGRLGLPRVRYCSCSDSRSPLAGPRVQQATSGLRLPPAAGSPSFSSCSRRSSEEGREEGCWSSGRLGVAGTSGGERMWSRERGAGRHAPQLLSRRLCTLPHPPPLHCRLGQVCVRGLVSAVSRAHLQPPGSRSLRLDLAPRFCGVGW